MTFVLEHCHPQCSLHLPAGQAPQVNHKSQLQRLHVGSQWAWGRPCSIRPWELQNAHTSPCPPYWQPMAHQAQNFVLAEAKGVESSLSTKFQSPFFKSIFPFVKSLALLLFWSYCRSVDSITTAGSPFRASMGLSDSLFCFSQTGFLCIALVVPELAL